jgi:hypothetical protein
MTRINAPHNASYAYKPASDKQKLIIRDTVAEITAISPELGNELKATIQEAAAKGTLTGGWEGGASKTIDTLFSTLRSLKAQAPAIVTVPAGRYAIKGQDGSIDFYQVDRPTQGKWAGYTFIKLLVGSVGSFNEIRQSKASSASILAKIEDMGAEVSARLFGQATQTCGHCSSPLSTPQSRCSGYGETCASKHGYWYASKAEGLAWDAEHLASC